jgi:hypothetical protein
MTGPVVVRRSLARAVVHAEPVRTLPPDRLLLGNSEDKGRALDHGDEALQAVVHGDWARRTLAGVAGPATEPGDGPGAPAERSGLVRIALLLGAAFQTRLQGLDDSDLLLVEYTFDRQRRCCRVASEHQLHGLGSGDDAQHHQSLQGSSVLEHATFDVEALRLERSKQLFDVPPQRILGDHLTGLVDVVDRMRGEQPPVDGFLAPRRLDLAHVDSRQAHTARSSTIGAG